MTTNANDRDLVDPALAGTWRTHSREEPPAALDAAILAAAHRASGARPRAAAAARGPWQWWWPLAAAATIGAVAIGVIQLLPPDRDVASTVVSDVPRMAESKREQKMLESVDAEGETAGPAKLQAAAPAEPTAVADAVKPAQPAAVPAGNASIPVPATGSFAADAQRQAPPPSASVPAPAPPPRLSAQDAGAEAKRSAQSSDERAATPLRDAKAPAERVAPDASIATPAKDVPDPFPGRKPAPAAEPVTAPSAIVEEREAEGRNELARAGAESPGGLRARRADASRTQSAPLALGAAAPASPPAALASRDRGEMRENVAQSPAAAPAPPRQAAPLAKEKSVDDWIATIRRLRAEGRFDEAAKELAAFRDAYPDADARLPPELRTWAAAIK